MTNGGLSSSGEAAPHTTLTYNRRVHDLDAFMEQLEATGERLGCEAHDERFDTARRESVGGKRYLFEHIRIE